MRPAAAALTALATHAYEYTDVLTIVHAIMITSMYVHVVAAVAYVVPILVYVIHVAALRHKYGF